MTTITNLGDHIKKAAADLSPRERRLLEQRGVLAAGPQRADFGTASRAVDQAFFTMRKLAAGIGRGAGGRELALAQTKLQECGFWFNGAFSAAASAKTLVAGGDDAENANDYAEARATVAAAVEADPELASTFEQSLIGYLSDKLGSDAPDIHELAREILTLTLGSVAWSGADV